MADALSLDSVTIAYDRSVILHEVSVDLPPRRITVLAGPNGCGKSSLLRALRRLLRPREGTICLDDEDLLRLPERELARRMALLTQTPQAPGDMTVFDLIRLGRYPHQSFLRQWSEEDARAVELAMAATNLLELRDRRLEALSGGQRQRVWLAVVLAQDTPIVCLDEPINHLDLAHQLECLELVRSLNRDLGKTVIVVLHDLNLAARYADHLVVLNRGRVHAQGHPQGLITETLVREVFGVESRIIMDPVHGCPLCIPIAKPPPSMMARVG
jgi:iron complex transport system ATP-binding protein